MFTSLSFYIFSPTNKKSWKHSSFTDLHLFSPLKILPFFALQYSTNPPGCAVAAVCGQGVNRQQQRQQLRATAEALRQEPGP